MFKELSLLDEYSQCDIPSNVDQDGAEAERGLQGTTLEKEDGYQGDSRSQNLNDK